MSIYAPSSHPSGERLERKPVLQNPLTEEERLKLGRWLSARKLTLGHVGECLVEYQLTHEQGDRHPLLPIWQTATRQVAAVELSTVEGLENSDAVS